MFDLRDLMNTSSRQHTRLFFRLHNTVGLGFFFLSLSKCPSHVWQWAELHFKQMWTVACLWTSKQLQWSLRSPLSTLSSELHWATDRENKKKLKIKNIYLKKRNANLRLGTRSYNKEKGESCLNVGNDRHITALNKQHWGDITSGGSDAEECERQMSHHLI